MEDLIACLYPYQDERPYLAEDTVTSDDNSSRHIEALKKATAPPGNSEDKTPAWHYKEGLQLTFSHEPKASLGFVLGAEASSCDIVLPPLPAISRRHCYITFDDQRRLIVRDTSTYGTIVKYDGKGGEKRRHFTWIIGGHSILDKTNEIVIQIDDDLKFQIVVSKPTFPDLFFNNVNQFRAEVAENDELPFGALGLQSAISTAAASGTQTPERGQEGTHKPNQNSILLRRKTLGKGAFSVVYHVWDVSTGFEYASKKFRHPKKVDWREEASLMKQTSHEHIIRLITTFEKPSPRLILEYLPLGNLQDQHRQRHISDVEVLAMLHQSLSALTYLHGQTPPIVHRDIKPENILVRSREPLHIKMADFGLSKASDYLKTLCGTHTYLAPEIARYCGSTSVQDVRYTNAVDIWSLGVVIFQYAYDLPYPGMGEGLPWCEKIISALNDWDADNLIDLLSTMIVMDPKSREPAWKCLRRALRLPVSGRSLMPTPAFYSLQQPQIGNEYQDTVVDCRVEDCTDTQQEDPCDSTRDSEIQRYIRSKVSIHSGAPTFVEKRKRSTQLSAASSASSGRRAKRNVAASLGNLRRHEASGFAEGLPYDPNCAGSFVGAREHDEQTKYRTRGGAAFARSPSASPGATEHEQITESAPTESYLVARLLQKLRDG